MLLKKMLLLNYWSFTSLVSMLLFSLWYSFYKWKHNTRKSLQKPNISRALLQGHQRSRIPHPFFWGKVPQICFSQPRQNMQEGRSGAVHSAQFKDSLLTGFHLQQSREGRGSLLPNGGPRLLVQRVGGNRTSDLQAFHGRPFLTRENWKHRLSEARLN